MHTSSSSSSSRSSHSGLDRQLAVTGAPKAQDLAATDTLAVAAMQAAVACSALAVVTRVLQPLLPADLWHRGLLAATHGPTRLQPLLLQQLGAALVLLMNGSSLLQPAAVGVPRPLGWQTHGRNQQL